MDRILAMTCTNGRVGVGLACPNSVLPIYAFSCWEEAWEPDLLLPGGVRPGGRQATDRGPAVPRQRRGGDGPAVRRPAGQSHPDATQAVSYTHLRAHETVLDLVCRLLLEKK